MAEYYGKLVRDNIPDLIADEGKGYKAKILDDHGTILHTLLEKLDEEMSEFKEDHSVEELVDILEVIYSIAEFKGVSEAELNNLRDEKLKERGGFDKKYYLIYVEE